MKNGQPAIPEETLEKLMEMLATLNELLRRKQKPQADYNDHFAALYAKVKQITVSEIQLVVISSDLSYKPNVKGINLYKTFTGFHRTVEERALRDHRSYPQSED